MTNFWGGFAHYQRQKAQKVVIFHIAIWGHYNAIFLTILPNNLEFSQYMVANANFLTANWGIPDSYVPGLIIW